MSPLRGEKFHRSGGNIMGPLFHIYSPPGALLFHEIKPSELEIWRHTTIPDDSLHENFEYFLNVHSLPQPVAFTNIGGFLTNNIPTQVFNFKKSPCLLRTYLGDWWSTHHKRVFPNKDTSRANYYLQYCDLCHEYALSMVTLVMK
ncbi:uncharacterized protein LOC129302360 isoform X1 [Prosopis cineraria]|uniref:uncharacterized protein LOC129302360 isoform X1 n=1 Tax=Prosopis cineraria TaxID=364024 RepID=UPI0024101C70|nr:uncharacterized protein LOC129302360 isoform X1 [Prosopis cineraria]